MGKLKTVAKQRSQKDAAAKKSTNKFEQGEEFIPALSFEGKHEDYLFKNGSYGVGYYLDNSKFKGTAANAPKIENVDCCTIC